MVSMKDLYTFIGLHIVTVRLFVKKNYIQKCVKLFACIMLKLLQTKMYMSAKVKLHVLNKNIILLKEGSANIMNSFILKKKPSFTMPLTFKMISKING